MLSILAVIHLSNVVGLPRSPELVGTGTEIDLELTRIEAILSLILLIRVVLCKEITEWPSEPCSSGGENREILVCMLGRTGFGDTGLSLLLTLLPCCDEFLDIVVLSEDEIVSDKTTPKVLLLLGEQTVAVAVVRSSRSIIASLLASIAVATAIGISESISFSDIGVLDSPSTKVAIGYEI